jgi:hypothetical protein
MDITPAGPNFAFARFDNPKVRRTNEILYNPCAFFLRVIQKGAAIAKVVNDDVGSPKAGQAQTSSQKLVSNIEDLLARQDITKRFGKVRQDAGADAT